MVASDAFGQEFVISESPCTKAITLNDHVAFLRLGAIALPGYCIALSLLDVAFAGGSQWAF